MATLAEIRELESLPLAQAEVAFLKLMIRHHQGGVAMAEQVLKETRRPEVVRLAESIVRGQQEEIRYMAGLLQQRGAAAPAQEEPESNPEHTHP